MLANGLDSTPYRGIAMLDNVPPCPSFYSRLKVVNLVFLLAGAAVAFVLVRRLTGSPWLAGGAFLLTAQNGQLLTSVDRFYTEPHAATLLILTRVLRVSDVPPATSSGRCVARAW